MFGVLEGICIAAAGWRALPPIPTKRLANWLRNCGRSMCPTVLDEPPHAFVGPFEEKAQAQNVLRYLKSDNGLDGLVTWRAVAR